MVNLDDKSRLEAEQIMKAEITAVNSNLLVIKGIRCAACHVLFKVRQAMGVSEQDATDLLSEVLLDYGRLNDDLITMVENIHMKERMMKLVQSVVERWRYR